MKKTLVVFAAVAVLAMMIPFSFGQVILPPNCGEVPGRTPGYWKHNINVFLDGDSIGYSWYFDDVKMNDDTMAAILNWLLVNKGFTVQQILNALTARGPGSEATRNNMNYWLNYAAKLDTENLI